MANRQKHDSGFDKPSNNGPKLDIDEHLLYSNQNIDLVKSSNELKKSVKKEP